MHSETHHYYRLCSASRSRSDNKKKGIKFKENVIAVTCRRDTVKFNFPSNVHCC